METRALGQSGLDVSRIVLGCGNFGGIGSAPSLFGHGESEETAFALMDAALAAGITVFDTADAYGGGRSEAMIGRWLEAGQGHRPLVATKTFNPMDEGSDRGLSRERILRQIETSLDRLRVERIDMYLTHAWDDEHPIAETLAALDELVRTGKVRAIGASNIGADQLQLALETSAEHGFVRFEWVQNEYSLLHREPEQGIFELCVRHGLGFTPFSPLAGGWLTGKYTRGTSPPAGSRMALRPGPYAAYEQDETYDAIERFIAAATARRVTPAVLALAWVLAHPAVTAAVVGPRRREHLDDVLPALELRLDESERQELAELFSR